MRDCWSDPFSNVLSALFFSSRVEADRPTNKHTKNNNRSSGRCDFSSTPFPSTGQLSRGVVCIDRGARVNPARPTHTRRGRGRTEPRIPRRGVDCATPGTRGFCIPASFSQTPCNKGGGGQNLVVVLAQHLHPFYNIK